MCAGIRALGPGPRWWGWEHLSALRASVLLSVKWGGRDGGDVVVIPTPTCEGPVTGPCKL